MLIFRRMVWLLFFIPLLLVTVLLTVMACLAFTSKWWPTTDGVVKAFYGTPDYRYVVNGQTYTCDYASCNEFFDGNLWAQNSTKYAVRYPSQAKVVVHYCPYRPSIAALETSFDPSVLIIIGVLALFTGLTFAGFLYGWRLSSDSDSERAYIFYDKEDWPVR